MTDNRTDGVAEPLQIAALDERPDLIEPLLAIGELWPTFMTADPIGSLFYATADRDFPEHVLVAVDPRTGEAVARAYSVPFASTSVPDRELPPDGGWATVIRWGLLDRSLDRTPTAVSAVEIAIRPDRRGQGLSKPLLEAMRANVQRLGFTELLAPVRPTGKATEPRTPMAEYVARRRPDGLPVDPWLRVHVAAGGEILRVCPRSMVIAGSLAEWRSWTGLPFDRDGDVVVPAALVPVHCSVVEDHAAYVEPNVWVSHRL